MGNRRAFIAALLSLPGLPGLIKIDPTDRSDLLSLVQSAAGYHDCVAMPDDWCPIANAYLIVRAPHGAPLLVSNPRATRLESLGVIHVETARAALESAMAKQL